MDDRPRQPRLPNSWLIQFRGRLAAPGSSLSAPFVRPAAAGRAGFGGGAGRPGSVISPGIGRGGPGVVMSHGSVGSSSSHERDCSIAGAGLRTSRGRGEKALPGLLPLAAMYLCSNRAMDWLRTFFRATTFFSAPAARAGKRSQIVSYFIRVRTKRLATTVVFRVQRPRRRRLISRRHSALPWAVRPSRDVEPTHHVG